nr:immunoglobulin heavy chain junction region [Macaca mulatta]MOW93848.1 immunoglobulin heavy chain junction region [Macaca mulatta]MOW93872.1 immunoglobulin heavy chain junction region [Macaca mulatta]MOW93984.1 immunoglobulin heavy chain junction region [Macaca mulatta]MOW94457.1 immunoglobulin heavy chain junction region [Macaca mulatta]
CARDQGEYSSGWSGRRNFFDYW